MKWPTLKLGQIAAFRNGLNFTSENFGVGLKVINVADFKQRSTPDYDSIGEINPQGVADDRDLLQDGDIIFVRSNGNRDLVGRSMLIRNPPTPVSHSAFTIRLRFESDPASPHFYSYFFRSPMFRKNLSSLGAGTNICNLNQKILAALEVPAPARAIQDAVTGSLSAYDDLLENNHRRITLLERAARFLYREWFVRLRFPGHEHSRTAKSLPAGWERKRIADVADCVGGGTPSTSVPTYWEDGTITWVTPTDVTRNEHYVLLDAEKRITESGLNNSSARLVPPHAVLMTSRASVGFFAVAGREVCTNQGFISVVPQDTTLSTFLLFQLSERVEEIRAMGSGSTYPEVSRGKFREFEVLLPPRRLVVNFDEQASLCLKQIRVLKQQNQKLRAARDLLLPRLMSGEITA